jgi:hypothetical protein
MSILNAVRSGKFSSDRSIEEYAKNIWNLQPCKVIETTLQKSKGEEDSKAPVIKVGFAENLVQGEQTKANGKV